MLTFAKLSGSIISKKVSGELKIQSVSYTVFMKHYRLCCTYEEGYKWAEMEKAFLQFRIVKEREEY